MSEEVTIARPYAKALFLLNIENSKKKTDWLNVLCFLSSIIKDVGVGSFLKNPVFNDIEKSNLIFDIIKDCGNIDLDVNLKEFIFLLSKNKRLLFIPDILKLYQKYADDKDKILNIDFISCCNIDVSLKKELIESLENRFNKKIIMNVVKDDNLLGGAIIRTKHGTIDGTIDDYLKKLEKYLKK